MSTNTGEKYITRQPDGCFLVQLRRANGVSGVWSNRFAKMDDAISWRGRVLAGEVPARYPKWFRAATTNTTTHRSPRIPAALSFKIPDLGRNDKNDAAPGPYLRPANMTDGRHRREMEERGLLGFDGEFSTTTDALKKVLGDIGIERIRAHRRRAAGDRNARGRVYIANKRHVTAELISMANHDRVDVFHDGRRP